jgi:hypothetical protein
MSKRLLAARSNWAFFTCAVASELERSMFKKLLFEAQQAPKSFAFGHEGYDGYMVIDARALDGHESFATDLSKAVVQVAEKISVATLKGDLSDRVIIDAGDYRFSFRISGYWMETPYDPPIEDPTELPLGGRMGRTVNVSVGLAA